MTTGRALARVLGLFSLGLGLVQLVAPRRLLTTIGVRPTDRAAAITRLVGARELTAAAGLVPRKNPTAWSWARVAGDAMDIGLMARALTGRENDKRRVSAAFVSVIAITAVDLVSSLVLTSESKPRGTATTDGGVRTIRRAVTVRVPRQQAYEMWRDFGNLPRFMKHLEEVRVLDDRRSHWRAKAPAGSTVEWDAEIYEDRTGEVIGWRSTDGSQIANSGRVRFVEAPGDRGTEVHVELAYKPPLGVIGATFAQLLGEEPAQQASDDLRRFKQIVETGRVPWSEATIEDRKVKQRPAQPAEQPEREPVAAHA
jgi:uncharacterized membrane protein